MKLVDKAMIDWCENNGDARDERNPAEKRIAAGEEFAGASLDRGKRAHAGKDHGGVREGVQPRELFKIMIAGHPDAKRSEDDRRAENNTAR